VTGTESKAQKPLAVEARVPPNDIDAEASVLSSILVDPAALDKVADILHVEHFYSEAHRQIYEAILKVFERGQPIDFVIVATELRDRERLAQAGGISYLTETLNAAPVVANVRAYAQIISDKWVARQTLLACQRGVAVGYSDYGSADEYVQGVSQALYELASGQTASSMSTIHESLTDYMKDLAAACSRGAGITGLATGFTRYDRIMAGLHDEELTIIAARPGMGKCQPLTAKVLTPSGWRTIGDLKVGDHVTGADGQRTTVTGVFEPGAKEIFRVVMGDGAVTECCEDHLWLTRTRSDRLRRRPGSTKPLKDIIASISRPGGGAMHSIQRLLPAVFDRGLPLPVDPYLLGLYLGDGWCGKATGFSNPEHDIQKRLTELLVDDRIVHAGNGKDMRLRSQAIPGEVVFRTQLERLGLRHMHSYEKFIPTQYLYASIEDRVRLLQGLCDSDGFVTTPSRTAVEISTASPRLAEGITFLVGALGGSVSVRERETHYRLNGEKHKARNAWRIVLSFPNGQVVPVSSEKHLKKWKGGVLRNAERFNVSVESTGRTEPVRCLMLDSADHLYVTDGFIVTHNTAFVADIIQNVIGSDGGNDAAVLFELEMPKKQITGRMLCSRARVDVGRVRTGMLTPADWSKLATASQELAALPLWIDDQPGCGVIDIRTKARRVATEALANGKKLRLIVADYLQLMRGHGGEDNREQEVSGITRGLKLVARELKVPVIALAQLNRECESRKDKRPVLSDLRESGAIEQDADNVVFIYRDDYYNKETADRNIAELIVAKQRNGATDTVRVRFDGQYTRFDNLADNEYDESESRYP
jgi:replicative DNA helicase